MGVTYTIYDKLKTLCLPELCPNYPCGTLKVKAEQFLNHFTLYRKLKIFLLLIYTLHMYIYFIYTWRGRYLVQNVYRTIREWECLKGRVVTPCSYILIIYVISMPYVYVCFFIIFGLVYYNVISEVLFSCLIFIILTIDRGLTIYN